MTSGTAAADLQPGSVKDPPPQPSIDGNENAGTAWARSFLVLMKG